MLLLYRPSKKTNWQHALETFYDHYEHENPGKEIIRIEKRIRFCNILSIDVIIND